MVLGYATDVDWLYFLAKTASGKTLMIARRNGPRIELLTRDDGWINQPSLLPRFLDPGFLEETTAATAQSAALELGVSWPPGLL